MELTFEKATPVEVKRGRTALPNPFLEAVKALADKFQKTGKSEALKTNITLPEENEARDKMIGSIVSQLKTAGNLCKPAVTVRRNFEFSSDGTAVLTFWPEKKITRVAKPKTDAETPAEAVKAE